MSNPKYDGRTSHKWKKLRLQVLAASDVCWLCSRPGADTVDHILPLALYPELAHDMSNLRPAHKSCNSRKGAGGVSEQVRPMPRSRRW
jgi:5-methylcytosine-specific restriction endonuclease McrA